MTSAEAKAAQRATRERLAQQKATALQTWHNWTPDNKPLVGRNPSLDAPAADKYVVLVDGHYRNSILEVRFVKGDFTDLGSIPRIFRNVISPDGRGYRGYLLHDELYRRQQVARVIADAILLSILLDDGVNHAEAYLIYYAVRMFGDKAWRDNGLKLTEAKAAKVFE